MVYFDRAKQGIGDIVTLVSRKFWSPLTVYRALIVLFLSTCTSFAFADDDPAAFPTEPGMIDFSNARTVWQNEPNLTGTGVLIAAVCRSQTYLNNRPQDDYRFNMRHRSLYDADVLFTDGSEGRFGLSSHATAIAGILLGLDERAWHPHFGDFQYRGVCPDASVDVYEFHQFRLQYLLKKDPFRADILTLSLGDIFEWPWVRAIERLAAQQDMIVVAGIGNGSEVHTPVLYPAAGANVIGVGVVDAVTDPNGNVSFHEFAVPTPEHSSVGPTDDRRCKPDLVAPGTALVPASQNDSGYVLRENWTSLSAPLVSGAAALLVQKANDTPALKQVFNQPGKNNVIKAVLLNSAQKLPYWHKGRPAPDDDRETPLDYTQGTGMLDAAAALDQLIAGLQPAGTVTATGWDNNALTAETAALTYTFDAADPNQTITATLCWNRRYQDEYPFKHDLEKDTDLRLELWGVDPNQTETLLDYSDSVNDNVEHLYLSVDPGFTQYRLRVRFNSQQTVTDQTAQRFALAWSVKQDTAAQNRWWNDLNADGTIDETDTIIITLLNTENPELIIQTLGPETLSLTPDRQTLLLQNWPAWKNIIR